MADKDRDYDEGEALDPELLYSKESCIGTSPRNSCLSRPLAV